MTLGFSAVFGATPSAVYPAAQLVASSVVAPLALASLASGVLIARLSRWGLFRYWWVSIKLAITLVLTIVLLTVLVPRLGTAAATAAAYGTIRAGQRVSLAIAPAVAMLWLIVNVALAVYKPAWHVRRAAHQRAATSLSEPAAAH